MKKIARIVAAAELMAAMAAVWILVIFTDASPNQFGLSIITGWGFISMFLVALTYRVLSRWVTPIAIITLFYGFDRTEELQMVLEAHLTLAQAVNINWLLCGASVAGALFAIGTLLLDTLVKFPKRPKTEIREGQETPPKS